MPLRLKIWKAQICIDSYESGQQFVKLFFSIGLEITEELDFLQRTRHINRIQAIENWHKS